MPSLSAILFAASEKLQINFRRSLSSSMLAHVTMPLLAAAVVGTHQRYSKQKGESSMTSRNLKRIAAFGTTAALVLAGMLVLESGSDDRHLCRSLSQSGYGRCRRFQDTSSRVPSSSVATRTSSPTQLPKNEGLGHCAVRV